MTPEQLMSQAVTASDMAREFRAAGDNRRAARCETRAMSLTIYCCMRMDAAADRFAEEGVMVP